MTTSTPGLGNAPGLPASLDSALAELSADAANVAILLDLAVESIGASERSIKRTSTLTWTARELAEKVHQKLEEMQTQSYARAKREARTDG